MAQTIGDNCFRGCTKLKTIEAAALQEIGKAAFHGCEKLEHATFPKVSRLEAGTSNQELEDGVFQGCSTIKAIHLPLVQKVGVNEFKGCSSATIITIPSVPVTGMSVSTFSECTSLKWLSIPREVPLSSMGAYRTSLGIPATCNVICHNGEVSLEDGKSVSSFYLHNNDNY